MPNALLLRDATEQRFYFRCTVCFRRGRYSRESLLKMLGQDVDLPSVPIALARLRGCPNVDNPPLGAASACGAHLDIAAMYLELKRELEARKHRRG